MNDFLINSYLSEFTITKNGELRWYNSLSINKLFIDKDNKFRMIMLVRMLNELEYLDKLQDGFTMDVAYTHSGDRTDYRNSIIFMSLRNCEIKQKWYDLLTISSPDDMQEVHYYLYIKGEYLINYEVLKND